MVQEMKREIEVFNMLTSTTTMISIAYLCTKLLLFKVLLVIDIVLCFYALGRIIWQRVRQ